MTTESDPTQPVPVVATTTAAPADPAPTIAGTRRTGRTASAGNGASRRPSRRHPAAGARVLAAGLATASTFGLVAVIAGRAPAVEVVATSGGAAAPAAAPVTAVPASTPPPVVVVRRTYVPVDGDGARPTGAPSASAKGVTTQRAAAPPVTAVPRRTPPVTRSSSS